MKFNKITIHILVMYVCVPDLLTKESIVAHRWCLTLQNHAVTGYAILFAEFEKTPISCGFAASVYETTCRLMMVDLAIQAIKNSRQVYAAFYYFPIAPAIGKILKRFLLQSNKKPYLPNASFLSFCICERHSINSSISTSFPSKIAFLQF